ncbi:hypothetical protein [Kitasatospora sp. NPDC058478]|uniref:hypothetical protein n=1 Tax=unclassified Kitasatospora TaxID=2633591 RepID=UPI00364C27B6
MATAILPAPQTVERGRFYTVEEAGAALRIGQRIIRDGINHNGWPHSRIGRRLVLSGDDLHEIYALYRATSKASTRGRRRAA